VKEKVPKEKDKETPKLIGTPQRNLYYVSTHDYEREIKLLQVVNILLVFVLIATAGMYFKAVKRARTPTVYALDTRGRLFKTYFAVVRDEVSLISFAKHVTKNLFDFGADDFKAHMSEVGKFFTPNLLAQLVDEFYKTQLIDYLSRQSARVRFEPQNVVVLRRATPYRVEVTGKQTVYQVSAEGERVIREIDYTAQLVLIPIERTEDNIWGLQVAELKAKGGG